MPTDVLTSPIKQRYYSDPTLIRHSQRQTAASNPHFQYLTLQIIDALQQQILIFFCGEIDVLCISEDCLIYQIISAEAWFIHIKKLIANKHYLKSSMGKTLPTCYALMASIVFILFMKSHSLSAPSAFTTSNKYIDVQTIKIYNNFWAGASPYGYSYVFATAKTNSDYKAVATVAQIAYTLPNIKILSYKVLIGDKFFPTVRIDIYTQYPQAFTLLTIHLLVVQIQSANIDFKYFTVIPFYSAMVLGPGNGVFNTFLASISANATVFLSIVGVQAAAIANNELGLDVQYSRISSSVIQIVARATGGAIDFFSTTVLIIYFDNSLLSFAFPPTRITYNTLSGTSGSTIGLKASDPQNIIRSYNTLIGPSILYTRSSSFSYSCIVTPSTSVQVKSTSSLYQFKFSYIIFQVKQCPASTPYLLVQNDLCYDNCPQRYFVESPLPKCTACPFDCSYCAIDRTCTSCNTVNDFRMLNTTTKRCVPLPGYYESNITKSGSCIVNCLICTNASDCIKCAKDLMFRDGQCVTNCTSLGITVGKQYVEIMKECFDCGDILQHSNGTAFNESMCNCNETFVFNPTNKTCDCPLLNSVVIEGKCFPCGSISLYSNGTPFNSSTCNCNETFIFNLENKTCDCPLPNSVVIGGKCFPCANISLYSNGTAFNTSTCNCNETFTFDSVNKTCICPQETSVVIEGKCFPCGNIQQYSNGTVFNQTICNCNESFIFNLTSKACECPFSLSIIFLGKCFPCTSNSTCACPPTFTFHSITRQCICSKNSFMTSNTCFSCSSIRYYNSTGLLDPKQSNFCECYNTFVFNPQINVCQCPDSLSYVSILRVCVSCRDIGNNTNEVNGAACKCLQSYVYDAKLNKCLCPPASIILKNQCFSCRTLNKKNASGLVSPINPDQCQCVPTFTFDPQTKQCGCPNDANYFVSKQNKCVSCLNIENGNGQADFSSKACKCSETYVYSTAQNKCLCSPRSIVLENGQCFSCQTLKNKNSSGLVDTTAKSACQCFNTFFFNPANKACECPQGQFVSKSGKCFSCAGAQGTGEFNQTSKECVCKQTYIYSSSLNKCVCPPTSAVINSQCFLCSALKAKNGTGEISKASSSVCQCLKTFVFTEAKTCECPNATNSFVSKSGLCVSCLGIANGLNDEADLTSKKCVCKQSFVYHQGTNQCRCPLSSVIIGGFCFQCPTLKNKNSTGAVSNTDPSSCSCLTSFVFDPASKTCLCPNEANSFVSSAGKCVSCIGIQNGQNDLANITAKTCVCKKSLVYVESVNKCECPQSSIIINGECFSCSTLMNKNSTGGINATTGNTCRCLRSYVFNPEAKVCQCPDDAHSYITPTKQCVSCSEVQNGTGAATKDGCECKDSSFVYNPSLNKCLCPPTHVFSGGSCILTSKSQTNKEVTCPENLKWDIFLQKCVCKPGSVLKGNLCIDCTSIANAKGDASDKISCICVEGYAWDSTEYLCK